MKSKRREIWEVGLVEKEVRNQSIHTILVLCSRRRLRLSGGADDDALVRSASMIVQLRSNFLSNCCPVRDPAAPHKCLLFKAGDNLFDGSCLEFTSVLFFFQAEDGIRDWSVTGVQTCALPISINRGEFLITHVAVRSTGDDPPTKMVSCSEAIHPGFQEICRLLFLEYRQDLA